MSAGKTPAGPPPERRTTATPFLIALVVAVLLIGGVLTWNAIRPSDERLSDSAQVQVTIGQYYGALNKGRYADLVANTCAKDRAAATSRRRPASPRLARPSSSRRARRSSTRRA